jgi:hypothetical protein
MLYDAALLDFADASLGPDAPSDASVNMDLLEPGRLRVSFSSATPLDAGPAQFVTLTAEVPDTAEFGTAHVLDLMDVRLNDGTLPGSADDAIHAVGYFGDTTGNGDYSGLDAVQIARVVVGLDSGFEACPLIDPAIIADVTGNGDLSGLDAVLVAQEVVGLDPPEIPGLPSGLAPQHAPGIPGVLAAPSDENASSSGVLGERTSPQRKTESARTATSALDSHWSALLAEVMTEGGRASFEREGDLPYSGIVFDRLGRGRLPLVKPLHVWKAALPDARDIDEVFASEDQMDWEIDDPLFEADLVNDLASI